MMQWNLYHLNLKKITKMKKSYLNIVENCISYRINQNLQRKILQKPLEYDPVKLAKYMSIVSDSLKCRGDVGPAGEKRKIDDNHQEERDAQLDEESKRKESRRSRDTEKKNFLR